MMPSPEMTNPFEAPVFDPQKYRQGLVEKIIEKKAQTKRSLEAARGKEPNWKIKSLESEIQDIPRQEIKLAKWSEEYHRARLLKSGNYTTNEHGEIVDKNSGLTTQELADTARLFDSFENSLDHATKTLGEVKLPEKILKSEKFKKEAQSLFWLEYHYGQGLPLTKAPEIIRFAKIFDIEEGLKEIISKRLEVAVENNDRENVKKIIEAFPYFDIEEFNRKFESKFYPIPEGLSGKVQSQELFGEVLEGEGEEISLEKILPLLTEKAELLANDLKNSPDFYWHIKQRLTSDDHFNTNIFGRWVLLKDDKHLDQKGQRYLRVLFFLGDDKGDPKPFNKLCKGPRLEFHFSCSQEDANKDRRHDREFTTTKIFKFQGLYAGDKIIGRSSMGVEDGSFGRIDNTEAPQPGLAKLKAHKQALKQLAEDLLVPEKDFRYSLQRLQSLAEKWGLPQKEVQELSRAIKEFGTYMYRVERSSVGDCLSTPLRFALFCRYKFGIKLDEARYGEYHPEWGNSSGYDPYTFLHQVLVYANRIVIDWTVTQYGDRADKPIPYIYEIGEERERFGPLYKSSGNRETPNEQFINDEKDPLYKPEPPISYERGI